MTNSVQAHVSDSDEIYQHCRQLDSGGAPYCEFHVGYDLTMFIHNIEQLEDIAAVAKEAADELRRRLEEYRVACEEIDASIDAEDAIEEARRV